MLLIAASEPKAREPADFFTRVVSLFWQTYNKRTPSGSHLIFCSTNEKLKVERRDALDVMKKELVRINRLALELLHKQPAGAKGMVDIMYSSGAQKPSLIFVAREEPAETTLTIVGSSGGSGASSSGAGSNGQHCWRWRLVAPSRVRAAALPDACLSLSQAAEGRPWQDGRQRPAKRLRRRDV